MPPESLLKEEIIQDQQSILTCIKYEILQGKSVEEAYITFSKTLGEIDYREFDFWFYRLKNGDFKEKRKDLEFKDLPEEIVIKIVEELGWKERSSLRKTCHSLRSIVDNSNHHYQNISLTITNTYQLSIDEQNNSYSTWKLALDDFCLLLKYPKLKICNLFIDFDLTKENRKLVVKMLKNGFESRRIEVKNLFFTTEFQNAVLAVLPYLKGLESIEIDNERPIFMNKMSILEQWKQAKTLKIGRVVSPVSNIFHFNRLTISLENVLFEHFDDLKEAFISTPTMEYLCIYFDNFFQFRRIHPAITPSRTPIPNSNLIFSIEWERECVVFQKIPSE